MKEAKERREALRHLSLRLHPDEVLRQRLDDRRFDYAFRSQRQRTEETPIQPVYAAGWRDPNYGNVIGNVRHANQPTPTTKIPKGTTP